MKRRDFIKITGLTGAGFVLLPNGFSGHKLMAATARLGLSDPALQPKFVEYVPDASLATRQPEVAGEIIAAGRVDA